MKIGISACLCGYNVRYDGGNKRNDALLKLLQGHELIMVCPEMEAGFPVPHEPIEIKGNRAFTKDGTDVNDQLFAGSMRCLETVAGCELLILKEKSPSCGSGRIYDGTFSGTLITGNGVFTGLCLQRRMKVFGETQLQEIEKELR